MQSKVAAFDALIVAPFDGAVIATVGRLVVTVTVQEGEVPTLPKASVAVAVTDFMPFVSKSACRKMWFVPLAAAAGLVAT